MGCASSDLKEKEGILTQQSKILEESDQHNLNEIVLNKNANTDNENELTPNSSEISSREPPCVLEGLGILSEVWRAAQEWDEFRLYLTSISEGEDSDGQSLSMVRYANFLEMYAMLDMEYRRRGDEDRLKQLVKNIVEDEEGFFDREKCLRCIDAGMRKDVLEHIKNVENGEEPAGPDVFTMVLPRVVDRMGEMLGNYQNSRG